MGILRKVAEYLYIKKRDPKYKPNQNVRFMNGMNRISIFVFIIALIILAIKLLRH
jgi:hypothetical protein